MRLLTIAAIAMLTAGQALAMTGGPDGSDPDIAAGDKALAEKNWDLAVQAFTKAIMDPKMAANADVLNKLGFATRSAGKPKDAIPIYARALAIDPDHKGAHEYAGEAFLRLGDLPNAKFHLARLDKICFFGCAEFTELKNKIALVEAGKPLPN